MSAKNISLRAIAAQKEPIAEQLLSSLPERKKRPLGEEREEAQADQRNSEQVQAEQTLEGLENVYEALAGQDPAPQFAEPLEFAQVGGEIGTAGAGAGGGVGAGASGIGTAGAAGAAGAGAGVAAGVAAGTAAAAGGVTAGAVAGTVAAAAAVNAALDNDDDAPPEAEPDAAGTRIFVTAEYTGAVFDLNGNGKLDKDELTEDNLAIFGDGGNVDFASAAYTVHFIGWGAGAGSTVPLDLSGFGLDDSIIVDWSRGWVGDIESYTEKYDYTTFSTPGPGPTPITIYEERTRTIGVDTQIAAIQRGTYFARVFNGYTWPSYNSRFNSAQEQGQAGTILSPSTTSIVVLKVVNFARSLSVQTFNKYFTTTGSGPILPGIAAGGQSNRLASWSAGTTIAQSQINVIWPGTYTPIA